jgi:hypothetical protein
MKSHFHEIFVGKHLLLNIHGERKPETVSYRTAVDDCGENFEKQNTEQFLPVC